MLTKVTGFLGALTLSAGAAFAGDGPTSFLMVPDSSNDRIAIFDPFDGSLINADWITLSNDPGTPKNAIQVGSEVWISDQIRDRVDRYAAGGGFLGTFAGGPDGGLDNIRGMELVGNTLYVTSSGTNEGAPGESTVMFDINNGDNLGSFFSDDSFDVLDTGEGLLINDIDDEDIFTYNYDGTGQTLFHDSDGVNGIDFPQQMNLTSSGTVLVAGFSSPSGIYEYSMEGDQLNYYDVGGIRGVWELGNGNIMFTSSGGVFSLNPDTGQVSDLATGFSAQYIELYVVPGPGGLALLGLAGIFATGRRRRQ